MVFLGKNMGTILKTSLKLIKAFLIFKSITFLTAKVITGFNIALGISTLIQGKGAILLRKNAVALKAYAIAARVVTAATWAWNAANLANPLVWVPALIIVIIALVTVMIKKWNEWGAALALLSGPLGFIVSAVQSFRRNWDGITKAFKNEGILSGLAKIGATITDAMLMPLEQFLRILKKIPGVGELVPDPEIIQRYRQQIGVETKLDESGNLLERFKIPEVAKTASPVNQMAFNPNLPAMLQQLPIQNMPLVDPEITKIERMEQKTETEKKEKQEFELILKNETGLNISGELQGASGVNLTSTQIVQ